jgi:LAS superfamily LD-carboxypeptidase LdcB
VAIARRQLLIAGIVAPAAVLWGRVARAEPSPLVRVRDWVRRGIERDSTGSVIRIFGLSSDMSYEILLRATRADALPDGYAPLDLVSASANGVPSAGRQLLRSAIVADTRALIDEAALDGYNLYIGSGFRSQAYQENVFAVQVARWRDGDTANRYSARPGHSQHQLGTTIDFTNEFRAFRGSETAAWLRDNGHRFGFVLPYTAAATELTGYVDEPWHGRWVGRSLATQLQSAGYQDWTELDVDDVIALVRSEAALDD